MDSVMISEIATRAAEAENLAWPIVGVARNAVDPSAWEIYYDAVGMKRHFILVRLWPQKDSTAEALEAEVRGYLVELKKSGRL